MLPALFAILIIVVIALVVLGMVVVGMEGTGRHRLPEVADTLARAGQHLNGEAEPPRGLVAFFEEAEQGASDLRQLPTTLRRRSAASAASAESSTSARSADSASTVPHVSAPSPETVRQPAPVLRSEPARAVSAPPSAWGTPQVRSEWEQPQQRSAWAQPEIRSEWGSDADGATAAVEASAPQPTASQVTKPAQDQPHRNAWATWSLGEDEG